MMYIKTLIPCLVLMTVSGESSHPKVREDEVESRKNENIRLTRSSESPYKLLHQPPFFNFAAAKQQDYLKHRYAQQQKVNTIGIVNGIAKSHKYLNQPRTIFSKPELTHSGESSGWQPFDPKAFKMNIDSVPGVLHLKASKNIKLYKPNLKVSIIPKEDHSPLLKRSVTPSKGGTASNSTPTSIDSGDLLAEGSEIVERKSDTKRRDSEGQYEKVIYLHPNQIQEHLRANSFENPNPSNQEMNKPINHLTALNDLVGKNPNVQLEGLKRLLEGTPSNLPVVHGPEPFQAREHKPIAEKMVDVPNPQLRPNIQVNSDNTITLHAPQGIDKGSFEDIQKQLDEASKAQAQQVIARAQQEAIAQVEAQHKAIALAQMQAQKDAFENIGRTLYGNPQALPLVQNEQPEAYQTVEAPSPQIHDVASHNSPSAQALHGQPNELFVNQAVSQPVTETRLIHIPLGHNPSVNLYKNVAPQTYGSKELLYYAPNHNQEAAGKTAPGAVEAAVHNQVTLPNQKSVQSAIRQILKTEQVKSAEASSIHAATEPRPESTAYQHFSLDSTEGEDAAVEEKDYDDVDDYAAKYAFGYRIKDAKEGNDFGHEERRDGKNLEGSYHVLLPDGRLQKVQYYADKSGYHAKVTYEHPTH